MAQKESSKKLPLSGKRKITINVTLDAEQDAAITNMMMDPRYLRQSSALIHDALQKGFDVLQLSNGDIVTTGTKTIVYQYTWDENKGKLAKIKPEKEKKAAKTDQSQDQEDEVMETEDEMEEA